MKSIINPFPIVRYKGPLFFCDRKEETKAILDAIKNDRSITLYSIRRLGKTGLIQHVLHKLEKKRKTITVYVDMYDTLSQKDFVNKLCTVVMQALNKKKDNFLKSITKFFGKYRPKISFDSVTGDPSIELDLVTDKEIKLTLDTIMEMIKESNSKVIIGIDEFQQINYYERKTLAATLRSYIQSVDNLCFIFSGSERHMLLDMFTSPKQALFRTTQLMALDKISEEEYRKYIHFHFDQGMRKISEACVTEIMEWTDRHTYYTQYLCHRLYDKHSKSITMKKIEEMKYQLLKENESIFGSYKKLLSPQQWKLLYAIAKEGVVKAPTASAFLRRYNLGSHSTVRLSLRTLENKQLVYSELAENTDDPVYKVYDLFLYRWIESL